MFDSTYWDFLLEVCYQKILKAVSCFFYCWTGFKGQKACGYQVENRVFDCSILSNSKEICSLKCCPLRSQKPSPAFIFCCWTSCMVKLLKRLEPQVCKLLKLWFIPMLYTMLWSKEPDPLASIHLNLLDNFDRCTLAVWLQSEDLTLHVILEAVLSVSVLTLISILSYQSKAVQMYR